MTEKMDTPPAPPCPECGISGAVYHRKTKKKEWRCRHCGLEFTQKEVEWAGIDELKDEAARTFQWAEDESDFKNALALFTKIVEHIKQRGAIGDDGFIYYSKASCHLQLQQNNLALRTLTEFLNSDVHYDDILSVHEFRANILLNEYSISDIQKMDQLKLDMLVADLEELLRLDLIDHPDAQRFDSDVLPESIYIDGPKSIEFLEKIYSQLGDVERLQSLASINKNWWTPKEIGSSYDELIFEICRFNATEEQGNFWEKTPKAITDESMIQSFSRWSVSDYRELSERAFGNLLFVINLYCDKRFKECVYQISRLRALLEYDSNNFENKNTTLEYIERLKEVSMYNLIERDS